MKKLIKFAILGLMLCPMNGYTQELVAPLEKGSSFTATAPANRGPASVGEEKPSLKPELKDDETEATECSYCGENKSPAHHRHDQLGKIVVPTPSAG